MSIQKLDNGTWRVRVELGRGKDGKRIRSSKNFKTKREAQAYEHFISEAKRNDAIIKEKITFSAFVDEIYLPLKQKTVRYNTLRAYKRDIKRLRGYLEYKQLDQITRKDVEHILFDCETYKTAKNTRDTLRQILNSAIEHGYLHHNVATLKYTFPERTVYPEDHNGIWLMTFDEHDKFIATIDHDLYKLVAVLGLSLGLRKGEIFGLDWSDIDLEKRLVHVQRTYVLEDGGHKLMPPKTKKSVRIIPLRKSAAEYLESIADKSGPVVKDSTGNRADPLNVSRQMSRYFKRNDIDDVSILNMRHSFATACLSAGLEIAKVSKLLGHTQITTTFNRYIRYTTEAVFDDFQRLIN